MACTLGQDKKRYKKWSNWIKDANTKMSYLIITQDILKLAYIKSQAGPDLLTFWEKEARER